MRADTAIFTAFDDFKGLDSAEPERNLMRSVLSLAMEDMRRGGNKARDARRFFLNNDSEFLLSFISICHHLNLCPKTIRILVGVLPYRGTTEEVNPDSEMLAA